MDQFIVATNDRPFGYLQCYNPEVWPDNGLGVHPRGTRGIYQFIGELDMVDRGHGSAFIRSFIGRLLAAGATRVITDPDPANARAIRANEKAGFRRDRLVETPDGTALLMVRNP
jgi:aminoglycoside 6'-N-acetyltransferase